MILDPIGYTPHHRVRCGFCVSAGFKALPIESSPEIWQALPAKSATQILQSVAGESEDRLTIDFSKHHHLGWTHYRILLGVEAGLKREFYFEQAAKQR